MHNQIFLIAFIWNTRQRLSTLAGCNANHGVLIYSEFAKKMYILNCDRDNLA